MGCPEDVSSLLPIATPLPTAASPPVATPNTRSAARRGKPGTTLSEQLFRITSSEATLVFVSTDREPGSQPESQPDDAPAAEPAALATRKVTEARELRALAHPARLRLLAEVGLRGTLTATQGAEIIGGTPAVSAYHLRTLAKYGFLEEAGRTSGRERPWKVSHAGFSWDEQAEDPAQRAVARALADLTCTEWMRQAEHYRDHADEYPAEVRAVSGAGEFVLFATPAEVGRINEQFAAILEPFKARVDPALRPESGYPPFELVMFTHPLSALPLPPPAGPSAASANTES
jgi:Helix-turn-helix domain